MKDTTARCKLLLTGFDTFGTYTTNVSGHVVSRLSHENIPGVVTEVLRTSYAVSDKRIIELIDALRPQVVLLTGQTKRTATLRIELKARNGDSPTPKHNDGLVGQTPI